MAYVGVLLKIPTFWPYPWRFEFNWSQIGPAQVFFQASLESKWSDLITTALCWIYELCWQNVHIKINNNSKYGIENLSFQVVSYINQTSNVGLINKNEVPTSNTGLLAHNSGAKMETINYL